MGISTLGAARISREPSELFTNSDGLESRFVLGLTEGRRGRAYAVTGAGSPRALRAASPPHARS